MESFFGIKNFKSRRSDGVFFSILNPLWVVRQWSTPLSGHASLSFSMIHKFPGTKFSLSVNFFDYNNILISMKKDAEHISVNTVGATFLQHM